MTYLPTSTYRLQLGPELTFDQAAAKIDYLSELGITDLYLSPILAATPGSTHGYDVIDHAVISEQLGGLEGLRRLARAARAADLGIIVDVVPNHMAVPTPASLNTALWSVLAHGAESEYANWFDVDWGEDDAVLMPVLGRRLGSALSAGEITVARVDEPEHNLSPDTPVLCYYEHRFPIREGTQNLPLPELLERQHYRLAYWRVADEELNYRRFFDVGTLVAVRVEVPEVFDATHALLLNLMADGLIDGLRIDHPDGLADPRGYFQRLDERTGGRWTVAEKILEPDEVLPSDWPTAGTTGYDASWRIGQLFVDPVGSGALGALLSQIAGDGVGGLPDLIERSKREIVTASLAAEVDRLTALISTICHDDVRLRDHTRTAIGDCVRELVIAADRYRAYLVPGEPMPASSVSQVEHWSRSAATKLHPERHETLDVVTDLVLGRESGSAGRRHDSVRHEVVIRFQQLCGAVMAKGVEDTAFYRWTHLVSLCEVGGAPARFAAGPDELHAWATATQTARPATMTAGSTHDNKRGEDVRARIGVLSEFAQEWSDLVAQLRQITTEARGQLQGRTENLAWQILAGTWTQSGPIDGSRLADYLVKAAREAKDWTTWTEPDDAGEQSLTEFAHYLVTDPQVAELMTAWVTRTSDAVRVATLGAKAIQLTVPGVADVYQGSESTVVALVDPDNRGPVDHQPHADDLSRFDGGDHPRGLGQEKLRLVAQILRLRRRRASAFVGPAAGYEPLPSSTTHAVAFTRTEDGTPKAVTVATRLPVSLARLGGWGSSSVVLPEGRWRDVVSGATYAGGHTELSVLLRHSPVAILETDEEAR